MMTKKTVAIFLFALAVTMLAGCKWTVKGEYNHGPWKVGGEISGDTSESENGQVQCSGTCDPAFDANDFALDFDGTTLPMPSSGTVSLLLYGANSTTPRVAQQFSWVRSGEIVFLSNPNAVNAWLDQNGLSTDTLKYEVDPIDSTGVTGTHTIAVKAVYNGYVQASSTQTFSTGSGCRIGYCSEQ